MKQNSKNGSGRKTTSDLDIPPITREMMRHGTVGKYYKQIMERSNVVRIDKELAAAFPNEAAVNEGLRQLLLIRETLNGDTAKVKRRKTA